MHLRVKNLNIDIFTHSPRQNSPPGCYRHPPGRRELLIPPGSVFWKIFPPAEGERKPLVFRGYRNEKLGVNGIKYLENLNCRKDES